MRTILHRRQLLASLTIAMLPGISLAQAAWPTKPIRIIVPASAGSGPEVIARLIGERLAPRLGQPLFVEAIPGAAGIIGTEKAMSAAPDGHTFLLGFNQVMTMNPYLYPKLPYDPVGGVAPVSLIARGGYVLIASPKAGFTDVRGLLAQARAQPGAIAYASTGNGSAAHLGMELIKMQAGIDLLHVPYKSGGASTTDLIAGQIQLKLEPQSSAVPLLQGGKVRALAVTTSARMAALPDVPTLGETIKGFSLTGWNALWAPPGTPAAIVERMSKEMRAVLQEPELHARLEKMGIDAEGSTPAALAELTRQESAQWGQLIQRTGIKAD
jgi:tripartite-type tricarboxylate transporter receptor subunit TctC